VMMSLRSIMKKKVLKEFGNAIVESINWNFNRFMTVYLQMT
jgi:hypothetical protein